jgi:hypothetical protein
MRVAVTGASGLIATALMPLLAERGHSVVRLVRREVRGPDEVRWDPEAGDVAGIDVGRLAGVDAVVHLAGAGVGDRRWTEEYKALIRTSRVTGTRTLVAGLTALDPAPRVLVSGSAVGYYGSRGDELLTEESPHGEGFLAEVCRAWETEATVAEQAGIRTVLARSGLVMTDRGGAFGRLLPVFRLGLGGRIGRGRAWWPWVTLDDEVRALVHCLEIDELRGPVNIGSPEPRTNADVTKELGRVLRRPAALAVPPVALRVALGEFGRDLEASQRMLPERLLASGFEFRHPDLPTALSWLVRG